MEASATTLNISGPEMPQEENGLPEVETVTIPLDALAEMKAEIEQLKAERGATTMPGGMTFEQLAYFIQEMKKPDADTQAKLDEEKKRKQKERDEMVAMAIAEDEAIRARQSACAHKKENGRTAIVPAGNDGQGMYLYLCQHCQKVMPPTRLNPDQYGIQVGGSMVFA